MFSGAHSFDKTMKLLLSGGTCAAVIYTLGPLISGEMKTSWILANANDLEQGFIICSGPRAILSD